MAGVTKIPDFVYFSICLVPLKLFLKKELWNFEKLKKIKFIVSTPKCLEKNKKKYFFPQKSYCFYLNLNFTCSQLSFEVYNTCFDENFQFFIFSSYEISIDTTFILWPLVAKIVIKEDYIWYQWPAKDQKNYLRSSFGILWCFHNFREPYIFRAQKAPPPQ